MTTGQVATALDGEIFVLKALALLTVPLQAVLAMVILQPGDPDALAILEVTLGAYFSAAPYSAAAVLAVLLMGEIDARLGRR